MSELDKHLRNLDNKIQSHNNAELKKLRNSADPMARLVGELFETISGYSDKLSEIATREKLTLEAVVNLNNVIVANLLAPCVHNISVVGGVTNNVAATHVVGALLPLVESCVENGDKKLATAKAEILTDAALDKATKSASKTK